MENQEQDLRTVSGPKAQLERIASPSPADAPVEEAIPAVDAWLERRLRVFERALAQLEARQEKTERDLIHRVALLEERLAACEKREPLERFQEKCAAVFREAPLEQLGASAPGEPRQNKELGHFRDSTKRENALAGPQVEPATEIAPEPVAVMPIAETGTAPIAETVEQKPMGEFLAHARRAANSAKPHISHPPKAKAAPRWMAWTAVGCAAMTATALALGTVAGASETAGSVSHRQTAEAFGRVIALADSGDPRDQTVVAFAYLRGQHQAADHAAAGRWAQAAAERGDPMAQYLLGALYQSGDGVAVDPAQAFRWFEASALRGNLKAMHNLAIAYAQGQGTDKNPERAAAWFNRAAAQGYKDSQFDLAVLYERGDGVTQNPERALKWYLIAARAGDPEALARAKQLEQVMGAPDVVEGENQAGQFIPAAHDLLANNL